jgi:NADH:ubiquinone oxidoreductase subunit 4 (subunit M)
MNWLIIVMCLILVSIIAAIIAANAKRVAWQVAGICVLIVFAVVGLSIGLPLSTVKQNIYDKHEWYMETRLKYAEAEGIEKEYLRLNDVMTYNLWYEKNKEDLENPWNFKSSAGCEFDYIKIN